MEQLPVVDFCGLKLTRLLIGANPFGGYSHQNEARDREMKAYYTRDRILETWRRAEKAGINAMITNNETPHVLEAVKAYLSQGGTLQWIAQMNCRNKPDMESAIDEAVEIGCKALYFHGALVDEVFQKKEDKKIVSWCDYARKAGIPAGVAGHDPKTHLWVNGLNAADFHCVCFFNCGSVHQGEGERFTLHDPAKAVETIRRIQKPCIGYKIMGAGRIDPAMAFEYAFSSIKPADVVNVGMFRGDKDGMVEENCALVRKILGG